MPTDGVDEHGQELKDYEVIVAVCGGIAAYKVCYVVSSLVQRAAGVTVVMTAAATKFVAPLTFQALSGREAITDLFTATYSYDPQHIRLTAEADLFIIAPATGNIIGKIVGGICDDTVSTMVAAAGCPVLLAPAMNDRMWNNRIVKANVAKLEELGYQTIGPAEGWLACRSVGPGRMVEPDEIIRVAVEKLLSNPPRRLQSTPKST